MENIRPNTFSEYKGQEKAINKMKIHVMSAKMRGTSLDHTLIYGNSGCGKSTLATVIANEMGGRLASILCPTIKKPEDMVEVLLAVQENDILFVDEIHSLTPKTMEVLYPVLEDGKLNAEIDGERVMHDMPPFTLIAATTDLHKLSTPLRNRFPIVVELVPYKIDQMMRIVETTCNILSLGVNDEAKETIARCSRGVPRKANSLVRCMRDYSIVFNDGVIDENVCEIALEEEGIDPKTGLTRQDMAYLDVLVNKYAMKSVGVDNIASAMNDNKKTIETVVEPYLIQSGYVLRNARGRKATNKAFKLFH